VKRIVVGEKDADGGYLLLLLVMIRMMVPTTPVPCFISSSTAGYWLLSIVIAEQI